MEREIEMHSLTLNARHETRQLPAADLNHESTGGRRPHCPVATNAVHLECEPEYGLAESGQWIAARTRHFKSDSGARPHAANQHRYPTRDCHSQ